MLAAGFHTEVCKLGTPHCLWSHHPRGARRQEDPAQLGLSLAPAPAPRSVRPPLTRIPRFLSGSGMITTVLRSQCTAPSPPAAGSRCFTEVPPGAELPKEHRDTGTGPGCTEGAEASHRKCQQGALPEPEDYAETEPPSGTPGFCQTPHRGLCAGCSPPRMQDTQARGTVGQGAWASMGREANWEQIARGTWEGTHHLCRTRVSLKPNGDGARDPPLGRWTRCAHCLGECFLVY